MQTDPATTMSEMPPIGTETLVATLMVPLLLSLVFVVIFCIGCWKMAAKAGMPGILGLIPIVNLFVLPVVGGKPAWWGILFFIPLVQLLYVILVSLSIAERFGRGIGTVLGLIFLTPIFVCILGFGDAEWSPPTISA